MSIIRVVVLAVTLPFAALACTEENPNAECAEALQKEQHEVGQRAARETEAAVDNIEGALDIQKETGLDQGQERLLRRTQEELRQLSRDLDRAFNRGCA